MIADDLLIITCFIALSIALGLVVGFAAGRGALRYCGYEPAGFDWRCTAAALVCAGAFAALSYIHGATFETLQFWALVVVLLFASATDICKRVIPNACIGCIFAVRGAYLLIAYAQGRLAGDDALFYLASALVVLVALALFTLVADAVSGRASLGGGDLKLYCAMAFCFGWRQCLGVVFLSCLLGAVYSLVSKGLTRNHADANDGDSSQPAYEGNPVSQTFRGSFPLAPFIAVSCVIAMVFGSALDAGGL